MKSNTKLIIKPPKNTYYKHGELAELIRRHEEETVLNWQQYYYQRKKNKIFTLIRGMIAIAKEELEKCK